MHLPVTLVHAKLNPQTLHGEHPQSRICEFVGDVARDWIRTFLPRNNSRDEKIRVVKDSTAVTNC